MIEIYELRTFGISTNSEGSLKGHITVLQYLSLCIKSFYRCYIYLLKISIIRYYIYFMQRIIFSFS